MSYPSYVRDSLAEPLAQQLYSNFGNIIHISKPPKRPINIAFKTSTIKSAYVLIDLKHHSVPPTTCEVTLDDEQYNITTTVNSPLRFCSYCKVLGHHKKQCPIRKKECSHCHQEHKLISCPTASQEIIKQGLSLLPEQYVRDAFKNAKIAESTPQWIEIYNNFFPATLQEFFQTALEQLKADEIIGNTPNTIDNDSQQPIGTQINNYNEQSFDNQNASYNQPSLNTQNDAYNSQSLNDQTEDESMDPEANKYIQQPSDKCLKVSLVDEHSPLEQI